MINLSGAEAGFIEQQAEQFVDQFQRSLLSAIKQQSPHLDHPVEISGFLDRLNRLRTAMREGLNSHQHQFAPVFPIGFDDCLGATIKTVIWIQRRRLATQLEREIEQFTHPGIRAAIQDKLKPFDSMAEHEWFQSTPPDRPPRLSDFLTLQRTEEAMDKSAKFRDREYDEKFHILQAPSLFIPDLEYYRERCETRGIAISVAYLDIDNFKTFNDKYGNSKMDRHLLPRFMAAFEHHLYFRGFAYRYGGDEYVILMPNANREDAVHLLSGLQRKLASLEYEEITEKPTVSIGLCVVDSECFLTEREIEERAENAKTFAKSSHKNCIATYSGHRFTEEALTVVYPKTDQLGE
jgi:diguanylate cyclase (GGDEF)-like protein